MSCELYFNFFKSLKKILFETLEPQSPSSSLDKGAAGLMRGQCPQLQLQDQESLQAVWPSVIEL